MNVDLKDKEVDEPIHLNGKSRDFLERFFKMEQRLETHLNQSADDLKKLDKVVTDVHSMVTVVKVLSAIITITIGILGLVFLI